MKETVFDPAWRTRNRGLRRFYAVYMKWLERIGYAVVLATLGGVLVAFSVKIDQTVEVKGVALTLADDGTVFAEGEFEGKEVPKAKTGQVAVLTDLRVERDPSVIVRSAGSAGPPVRSSRLLDASFADWLGDELRGKAVRAPDDLVLEVKGVESVEIDARLGLAGAPTGQAKLDPDPATELAGRVVEGEHTAEVQLAQLPEPLRSKAAARVSEALSGTTIQPAEGGTASRIESVVPEAMIVKLSAEGVSQSPSALEVARVSRAFRAKVQVGDPPAWLVPYLRELAASGGQVKVNVKIKVGTQPIAMTLLRRS